MEKRNRNKLLLFFVFFVRAAFLPAQTDGRTPVEILETEIMEAGGGEEFIRSSYRLMPLYSNYRNGISFFEKIITDPQKRAAEILFLVAGYYELAGNLIKAAVYYEEGAAGKPIVPDYFRKGLLDYTRLLISQGEFDAAFIQLDRLLTGAADDDGFNEALFLLYLLPEIGYMPSADYYALLPDTVPPRFLEYLHSRPGTDFRDGRLILDPDILLFYGVLPVTKGPEPEREPASVPVFIQLGSFRDRENAENFQSDLRKAGYDTEVEIFEDTGKLLYRVIIPVLSQEDAGLLLDRIKKSGYDGFIRRY